MKSEGDELAHGKARAVHAAVLQVARQRAELRNGPVQLDDGQPAPADDETVLEESLDCGEMPSDFEWQADHRLAVCGRQDQSVLQVHEEDADPVELHRIDSRVGADTRTRSKTR